ncbi:MAG: leucine-rich repeat protein [Clostridia bacterium]|nr:leucine-rich repeat protein [Clostridia bacterium]
MKKTRLLVLIVLVLSAIALLTACTDRDSVKVTLVYGMDLPNQTIVVVAGGKITEPEIPEVDGYTFVRWELDNSQWDVGNRVYDSITLYAVWQINSYTVTFYVEDELVYQASVEYQKGVTPPQVKAKEYYTFAGWYCDGVAVDDFDSITNDMTFVATFEFDAATMQEAYAKKLDDEVATLRGNGYYFSYSQANWTAIEEYAITAKADLSEASTYEAVVSVFDRAVIALRDVPTLLETLRDGFDAYRAADYFEEDYATIEGIFAAAVAQINAYTEGAPSPEKIMNDALESMAKVPNKALDIAAAETLKPQKVSELTDYAAGLGEENYTLINWAKIQVYLEQGIDSINAAVGTRAVLAAFNAAKANMDEVEITLSDFASGTGIEVDPYIIKTLHHLQSFVSYCNAKNELYTAAYYKMEADIDWANAEWVPVCNEKGNEFTGYFDGNNHTVSNIRITAAGYAYAGFIGCNKGTVTGLALYNVVINMETTVNIQMGTVVGRNEGLVEKCSAEGSIDVKLGNDTTKTSNYIGGLVGYSENKTVVTNCYANMATTITCNNGNIIAGGLVGYMNYSTISFSYANGTTSVTSVTSAARVDAFVGGMAGVIFEGKILNSFVTVAVSANCKAGAMVGNDTGLTPMSVGDYTNSYYATDVTVQGGSYTTGKGTGVLKATLLTEDFIFDTIKFDAEIWSCSDEYPVFAWQTVGTKYNVTYIVDGAVWKVLKVAENKTARNLIGPDKDGYIFSMWTFEGGEYNFSTPITRDIELTAVYIERTEFYITYTVEGTEYLKATVAKGDKAVKPADPTKENYIFQGWYDGDKLFDFETAIYTDYTLTASFIIDPEKEFIVENGVLTKYLGAGGDIVIPAGVKSIATATMLANGVFANNSLITGVTFPEGFEKVGKFAFCNCTNLKTLNGLGADVVFEDYTFNNTGLTSFTFPANMTNTGASTFNGCKFLASVVFNEKLTTIGANCFNGCVLLTEISLPASVTSLGNNCFNGTGITALTLPATVTTLGTNLFYNCKSLTTADISALTIATLPNGMFGNCSALTSVKFNAEAVTAIGTTFFVNCTELESVSLPAKITALSSSLFSGCSALKSVTIPSGVVSIASGAFSNCKALTALELPLGLQTIANGALQGCTSITAYSVAEGNKYFKAVEGVLYNFDATTLVAYPTAKEATTYTLLTTVTTIGQYAFHNSTLTEVILPEGLSIIDMYAFRAAAKLTSIVIPASVTRINAGAFYDATTLATIKLYGETPPVITSNTFYNTPASKRILVKKGFGDTYKAANIWSSYANLIEEFDDEGNDKFDFGYAVQQAIICKQVFC